MDIPKIPEAEYRLCLILWEMEPVKSAELVRACQERLGWKETTTYTVLKRLCQRGVLVNERTIVRSLVSKEQMQQAEMEDFVERTFEGSVPSFVAAFAKFKKISQTEIDQLQEMIDSYRKGEDIG